MRQSPAADPFAHCSSQPALTPGTPYSQRMSRTEATTVPRLQPEEFASPLQSGLRYGIMSHISAQPGFSPGSSQQVWYMMRVTRHEPPSVSINSSMSSRLLHAFLHAERFIKGVAGECLGLRAVLLPYILIDNSMAFNSRCGFWQIPRA